MKQSRLNWLNILIPIVASVMLSVAIGWSWGSDDVSRYSVELFLFFGWCSGHFVVLLLLAIIFLSRRLRGTVTYALLAANIAACLITFCWYFVVMDAMAASTSSTAAIAVLTFPVVGFPVAALAFAVTSLVMWWRGNKRRTP